MKKSRLLFAEPPLVVQPSLAKSIGLNEAIVLQQLHYWLENPKIGTERNGEKWIFNTYDEWQENFPFWSVYQIQRIFLGLEKGGLVIARQLDIKQHDAKKFYRIDYDKLCMMDDANLRPSNTEKLHDDNGNTETTPRRIKKTYRAQTPDPDNRDVVGTPDFRNMSVTEVLHIPEIQAFKEATGWTPGTFVCETVYTAMRSGIDKDALRAAFNAWCARGYKPANVAGYLEWARHGIPDQKQYNNKGNKSSVQNDLDKLQKWVEEGA